MNKYSEICCEFERIKGVEVPLFSHNEFSVAIQLLKNTKAAGHNILPGGRGW